MGSAKVSFIGIPGVSYQYGIFVAKAKGFFARNGIDATLDDVAGGGSIFTAAQVSGHLDVTEGDFPLTGPYIKKGIGFKAITDAGPGYWTLVASQKTKLPSTFPANIQALKGKTVGVIGLGTSSYFWIQQVLAAAGMPSNSVTFAALGAVAGTQFAALSSGQVSATVALPAWSYAMAKKGDSIVFPGGGSSTSAGGSKLGVLEAGSGNQIWVTERWASEHKDLIPKIQLSLEEADVWMHNPANLSEVVSVLSSTGNIPSFVAQSDYSDFVKTLLPGIHTYLSDAESKATAELWQAAGVVSLRSNKWYVGPTSPEAVVSAVQAAGMGSLGSTA